MTNAEFAILTLIAEHPRHGYEIERIIEERGMREWTEVGFSSIYYLLKKLEKRSLIESRIEQQPGRGPARKVYCITPAGKNMCRQATLEALARPHHSYPPLQLGLANLPGVSVDEALAALRQHRDRLVEQLAYLRGRWEAQRPLPYFVEAMFDHSLTMIEAEKAWLEKFIKHLEKKNV